MQKYKCFMQCNAATSEQIQVKRTLYQNENPPSDKAFRLGFIKDNNKGSKRRFLVYLDKDNIFLSMRDERILTGCKTKRSSLSGLVRLVPKMMNPELMPAEWRALSKLESITNKML